MLLRPPFIQQEDVKSQTSNPMSQMQKQKSVKSTSKNKKKQNTLGMKKTNMIGMPYNNNTNIQTQNNNYDSDNGSVHSVNSRKSKGKTKQSTIAIGKKQPQNMNQNSAYSIKNQNKKQQYEIFNLDSDDDKSVGSHASKNSRKNTVKQNSLGGKNKNPKVSVQLNYYYNQKEQQHDPSPRNYYMQEESKVQIVKLNENVDTFTQPLKYNEALKGAPLAKNPQSRRRTQQVSQKPTTTTTSSPFEEITLKRQQEYDDEPVYRLKEPQQNVNRNYKGGNNLFSDNNTSNNNRINRQQQQQQNPFSQRNNNNYNNNAFTQNTNKTYEIYPKQTLKPSLQQSSTIQPQMISTKSVTKSRRNKIFDNDNNSISNSSNIMNSRSNIQGSFQKSRSKSKSKLGELLKQSREKKEELTQTKERQVNMKPVQLGYVNQSKNPQQKQKQQYQQQQRRYQNQNYNNNYNYNNYNPLQQNTSQVSNKNIRPSQQSNQYSYNPLINENNSRLGGQKLAENHLKPQPIQRKSIDNQVFDLGQSQMQLNLSMSHKVPQPSGGGIKGDSVLFNFQSQKKKGISITSKEKPSSSSAENKSLQSKKHLDRLMKKCQQNQQFLAKSILSNNSQLRQSKKPTINVINSANPNIMKREETLNRPFERIKEKPVEEEPAWHQMVKNDAAFQIKQVQRKQVRRPSQQVIQISPPDQTKPMSPAQFFRLQNQQYQQKNTKTQQNQQRDMKTQNQLENEKRIQQQEKNRILAQISKKSKPQSQKQISYINNPSSNKNISSQPFYKQISDEEINLNYSNPLDIKQKQIRNDQQPNNYIKDQVQTSSLSHQLSLSQNGSERSNSQSTKKQRKKQSSLNIMKKHKVQVREQQPRAQESFYQQPPLQIPLQYKEQVKMTKVESQDNTDRTFKLQASKTKVDYKKPNLINFQQNQIEQEKIKSKTDMNFYNYGQGSQRSIRPPSSKPPLSRKSNCSSSKSKSKAKESTLNINPVKKETKIKQVSSNQNNNQYQQQPKKKKTLLEIAQDKQYQGSAYGGSDSQCSFNSRQSFGSVNSKNSRRSSSSKKQSTLPITIKNKSTTMNQFRPSLNKLTSTNSQVEIFSNIDNQSIYNSLQEQSVRRSSRERQRTQQYVQQQYPREQRTIVSKDTYFIDERGRLVKQDLIIKGNKIYSQPGNRSAQQMAIQRMKRSREHHRSRSKSRDGSRSRLSKKTSQSSMQESGYESASSSNYYNNNNRNGSNTNYDSRYGGSSINQQRQQQQSNLYIQQFIKPIQQPNYNRIRQQQQPQSYKFQKPSTSNQRKIEQQFYQNQQQQQYYQSYYQNDNQYEQYDEQPEVQHVTMNQLFGRNQKQTGNKNNNNNNTNSNYYNTKQSSNNYYQQSMGQNSNYNNNNYTNNNSSSRRQQYNGTNSRFNGQQSAMTRQSNNSRKKSLSRTQKTFYNK